MSEFDPSTLPGSCSNTGTLEAYKIDGQEVKNHPYIINLSDETTISQNSYLPNKAETKNLEQELDKIREMYKNYLCYICLGRSKNEFGHMVLCIKIAKGWHILEPQAIRKKADTSLCIYPVSEFAEQNKDQGYCKIASLIPINDLAESVKIKTEEKSVTI